MSIDRDVNEYAAKTARSRALFEEALLAMPGGNSRTTTFFDPYPFYLSADRGPTSGTPTATTGWTSTATTRA